MKVTKKQSGSELLVMVEGSIDSTTAPDFNKVVSESLKGVETLIFDFKEVDYISSAGLRVLLVSRKGIAENGRVIIRNSNKNVKDIFVMTGFDNILEIED